MKKNIDIRFVIGMFVIILGTLLILENLSLLDLDISKIFLNGCSILIIIGLIVILSTSNFTGGLILITIGAVCHMPELWPIILIGVGLYIILRVRESSNRETSNLPKDGQNFFGQKIDEVAIFGGGKKIIKSDNFMGGKITTIFGGLEINLLESKLTEGESTLELLAMFGGSTIFIPSDWEIKLDVISIFGGYSDSRKFLTKSSNAPTKLLIIKGLVIFGGGEIKN